MEPVTWGFIGAIVGTAVGAGASIFTTRINASNAAKLQMNEDIQRRKERARAFQRENLLQLQEALSDHMRLTAKAYLEDCQASIETENTQPTRSLLSEPLNQDLFNSNRRLSVLVERVADDSLRKQIYVMRQNMTAVLLVTTKEERDVAYAKAVDEMEPLMQRIGAVLRGSY